MSLTVRQLVDGIPPLGSYGGIITQIEKALRQPSASLDSLAEVIEKDPDLASRLMRLGNSAFFAFPNRLETVTDAIRLIGIQQVQDLILASSVVEVFQGISRDLVDMESFWKHSLACGIGARCVAQAREMPKADKLFVAGLLHDLGRLVLFSRAPQEAVKIFAVAKSRKMLLRDAESEVLKFDHARLGEELMRYWRYPPMLVQIVACHHHPMSADAFQLETCAVHLADYLVHAMQMGNSGEPHVPPLNLSAWERIGLPAAALESVINAIDEQIEAVQQSFATPSRRAPENGS
jgi:HD-like signal output (HDOD) protein